MDHVNAKGRVERFVGGFDEPYRLLAYHAAIPLILTPELLNYLHNKFLGDKVPWVAEADLLLSDICREIGYEQYAMDAAVRAYLLNEANEKLGHARMREVASLLINYVQHLSRSNTAISERDLQSQRWAAMVYLDEQREAAVYEIAESLRNSLSLAETDADQIRRALLNESELARLSRITQTLAPHLAAFPELVEYAISINQILAAIDKRNSFRPDMPNRLSRPTQVMDVTLPALEALVKAVIPEQSYKEGSDVADDEKDEEQIDVFISATADVRPFLDDVLLPRLKSAGLNYILKFPEAQREFARLPEITDVIGRSRHVLLLITPQWINLVWPTFEQLFNAVSGSDELDSKILCAVIQPVNLPAPLTDKEYFDLSEQTSASPAGEFESLISKLEEEVLDESHFGIIGNDPKIRQMREIIRTAASSDASVLIEGESGTGKELVAAAFHRGSKRAEGPFIRINCAALPSELMESELFGYRRGAFTGADRDKRGLIEAASGGTLLLDEIAEMPAHLQTKLLRVLQDRRLRRLGDEQEVTVDFRLVSSTNRDTAQMIQEGMLRKDLFFRISTVRIKVPPLRERGNDIVLLARHFSRRYAAKYSKQIHGISPPALALLTAYDWPGNVRELESVVEHAMLFASGPLIQPKDWPENITLFNQKSRVRTSAIKQAKAYAARGRFNEAERLLKDAMSVAPDDLAARVELAKVYRMQRKYAEAEPLLKQTLNTHPDQQYPRTELAKVYQAQKRYTEAESLLKESLLIASEHLDEQRNIRRELAKVYVTQKRFAEAEKTLTESLRSDPDDLATRIDLAKLYLLQKRLAQAEELLLSTMARAPRSLRARIELSRVFRVQRRLGEAEDVLKEGLHQSPNETNLRIELSRVYQIQNRYKEAEAVLLEALQLRPSSERVRSELNRIEQYKKRLDEETEEFKTLHEDETLGYLTWRALKHQTGVPNIKRGKLFTKLIKEISVAARTGGGDPDANARLRKAVSDAKGANMPNDTIARAIRRGTGEEEGVSYEEITYEGYGPGGVAVMVDSMTDNRYRTVAEIRHIFSKNGGNLGTAGAVNWMFEKKGYIVVAKEAKPEEELFEIVTDAGAEDLRDDEDSYEVITSPDDFDAVLDALKKAGVEPQVAEVEMVPKEYKRLEGAEAKQMLKLMEALEDHDDVQKIAVNFAIEKSEVINAKKTHY